MKTVVPQVEDFFVYSCTSEPSESLILKKQQNER